MILDDLVDEPGEAFLVHGGDVVEAGAVLVDVGSDAGALRRDVRVVLHHEQVARREGLRVALPLQVPHVGARNEVAGFTPEDGQAHREEQGLERHVRLVRECLREK